MGWTFHAEGSTSAWTTGTVTSSAFAVSAGDLIVCAGTDSGSGGGVSGIDDTQSQGASYKIGNGTDYGVQGTKNALTTGYLINSAADASMQVSITFTGNNNRKNVWAGSFTPDSGETVSFDVFMEEDGSSTTPMTTSDATTGDDEVCVAFLSQNNNAEVGVTNRQIPDGTAADASITSAHQRLMGFYTVLEATEASCEASCDLGSTDDWSIHLVCFKSAAAGVNVNVGHVTLTLTKYNPTVKTDINFTVGNVALTQTTYQATVNAAINVQVGLGSLSLTTYQTNINEATNVQSGYLSLALTTYQASTNVALNISADYDALTLTTYQASVNLGLGIDVGVVSLTLTTYQATVNAKVEVGVGYSSLALTVYNPVVTIGGVPVNVNCGLISLTLTKYNVGVNAAINVSVGLIQLTQTEYAANINSEIDVAVDYDTLTLTTYQSEVVFDVFISVDVDTITLSVYKANVSTGAETYLKRGRGFLLGNIYGKT